MPGPALRAGARADVAEVAAWYEGERRGLGRERDVRRVLVRRFPYAPYFVAEPARVVVVACVHVRRGPRVWQSRR